VPASAPGRVRSRGALWLALNAVLWTVIVVSVVVAYQTFGVGWAIEGGDGWNYLAAGERLNAGHPLYELLPGDRVVVIVPPYWSVPLLAPPPIAVLWRPLALLGEPAMTLWGALGMVAVICAVVYLVRRGSLTLLAAVALPVALVALSGNASAFLLLMFIGIWVFRDRPWVVGALIAVATAVKVTPAVLVLWLIVTGRWRAVAWTVAFGLIILGISVLGAGVDAHRAWLASASGAAPSPIAIASLTGLPVVVVAVMLAVPVLLAYGRDRWAFGCAVVAAALSTPALYFTALALLAAVPIRQGLSWRSSVTPDDDTGISQGSPAIPD
jgi:hypothetical protein